MIPAIHYFVLYYDLTVSMLIWSFSATGNGHCVADRELKLSFCSLFAKQSLTGINFD